LIVSRVAQALERAEHAGEPGVPSAAPTRAESAAMTAIGDALATLNDPAERVRVLEWANERFGGGAAPTVVSQPRPAASESVASLLAGFVADFQQLVREWHGHFD